MRELREYQLWTDRVMIFGIKLAIDYPKIKQNGKRTKRIN